MKKACFLLVVTMLLFVAGCQQHENTELKSDESTIAETEQESGIGFKKLNDTRNPTEFMTPKEIEMVQEVFKQIEGRRLKNPVIKKVMT